jgi:small subunit ribosomal protein S6e
LLFYFFIFYNTGLTDSGCELPSRLGPKRATRILKQFGLVSLYKKKSRDTEERKNLRYLITKYANKRTFTNAKGKEVTKRPKIQRLITPERLRRKRNNALIKEENRKANEQLMKKYRESVRALRKPAIKKTLKK